jgi:peptidoglycan/xylan/chitin deacetylase (PgdA/CDA1 family)
MNDAPPTWLTVVDHRIAGTSALVEAFDALPMLPSQRVVKRTLEKLAKQDVRCVVVLPARRPKLIWTAWRHGAHRIVVYFDAKPLRLSSLSRAILRAMLSVSDSVLAATVHARDEAIHAGADPERTTTSAGDVANLLKSPRRSRAAGAVEIAISAGLDSAEQSGLLRLFEMLRPKKSLDVLNYHRVLPLEQYLTYHRPQMSVTEPVFRAQMRDLSSHRGFAPLDVLYDGDPRGRVLITFDDGYIDNATFALPILRSFQAPACIFLATGFIGTGEALWWDRVGRMLQDAYRRRDVQNVPENLRPYLSYRVLAAPKDEEIDLQQAVSDTLTRLNSVMAPELLSTLPRSIDETSEMLAWSEVTTLEREGLSFGSHTREHIDFSHAEKVDALADLVAGHKDLVEHVQHPAQVSALPRGQRGELTEHDLTELGFAAVMTTDAGSNRLGRRQFFLRRRDGQTLTLRGRHHPAKLRLEMVGYLDGIRRLTYAVDRGLRALTTKNS